MSESALIKCAWCGKPYVRLVGPVVGVTVEFRCPAAKCGMTNVVKADIARSLSYR